MEHSFKDGSPVAYNVVTGVAAAKLNGGVNRIDCLSGTLVTALAVNSAPVYIGASDVTAAQGFELAAGQRQLFPYPPDELFVISAAPQNVRVMVL